PSNWALHAEIGLAVTARRHRLRSTAIAHRKRSYFSGSPGSAVDSPRRLVEHFLRAAALSLSRNLDLSRPGGPAGLVRHWMCVRVGFGGCFDGSDSWEGRDVRV